MCTFPRHSQAELAAKGPAWAEGLPDFDETVLAAAAGEPSAVPMCLADLEGDDSGLAGAEAAGAGPAAGPAAGGAPAEGQAAGATDDSLQQGGGPAAGGGGEQEQQQQAAAAAEAGAS